MKFRVYAPSAEIIQDNSGQITHAHYEYELRSDDKPNETTFNIAWAMFAADGIPKVTPDGIESPIPGLKCGGCKAVINPREKPQYKVVFDYYRG